MCIARTCKLSSMNSSCLVWMTWDTYHDTNAPPVFLCEWWGAVEKTSLPRDRYIKTQLPVLEKVRGYHAKFLCRKVQHM